MHLQSINQHFHISTHPSRLKIPYNIIIFILYIIPISARYKYVWKSGNVKISTNRASR
jgi:hypothetical protein